MPLWKQTGQSLDPLPLQPWSQQSAWHRVGTYWKQEITFKNEMTGTSLVAQWLRIHLPMQGTRIRALVQEDPTCRRATKPVCHNYWDCALEPASHSYWARMPQLLKPTCLEPVLRNEKPPQWEACAPQRRVAPHLAATRESPRAATKTQCSQK